MTGHAQVAKIKARRRAFYESLTPDEVINFLERQGIQVKSEEDDVRQIVEDLANHYDYLDDFSEPQYHLGTYLAALDDSIPLRGKKTRVSKLNQILEQERRTQ